MGEEKVLWLLLLDCDSETWAILPNHPELVTKIKQDLSFAHSWLSLCRPINIAVIDINKKYWRININKLMRFLLGFLCTHKLLSGDNSFLGKFQFILEFSPQICHSKVKDNSQLKKEYIRCPKWSIPALVGTIYISFSPFVVSCLSNSLFYNIIS